ncbi:MAG: VCBS repeat-containing protein [Desulfovibrio sp.]|jgi:hypothetical protein|nr:VCBS repeat-containing protein [Desulfovibrio sp.]
MKRPSRRLLLPVLPLLVVALLSAATQTFAAQKESASAAARKSTFTVAPFSVQGPPAYAHLERSLPQMLTSRLYWKDRVEAVGQDLGSNVKPVTDQAGAEKFRAARKADYVVWGTVNIIGDNCSIDVRVLDKNGKTWAQAREAAPNQIIPAVSGISDAVNRELFNRVPQQAASSPQAQGRVNQMNPDIMINETSSREVYLNPQFRYSGSSAQDDSRLRSAPLNFSSVGMEVTDADGDGKNEIFLLDDRALHAYSFSAGQMQPKGEFRFPANSTCLNVRSMPHASGKGWIIVNTVDSGGVPNAYILNWSDGQFSEVMGRVRWYLNVVKLPPNYRPTLIGQEANPPRLFRMGVHEMNRQGDTLVPGGQLNLPTEANLFNFTWLPASKGEIGGEKLIVLTRDESLRTYNSKLNRLAVTSEKYSGSSTGLAIDPSMPGMQHDNRQQLPSVFYIPMRMPAVDLERDGVWKLIVNRPISTAAQIFDRYRYFPQSEIHCLFWDGVGLNLQWKTRRIKGSMVDYTIADADNDGIPDLTVCINTHPGALGVSARKTMVLIYPLDISKTSPGTAPDKSDMYE